MIRVENLLERLLEKLETGSRRNHTEEPPERLISVDDSMGIDVVNTSSMIPAFSSSSAVVSVFRNASVRTNLQFHFLYQ